MSKKKSPIRGKPRNKSGFTFSLIHKIVPILIIFISLWISTQSCARDVNYDESLMGKPWFIFKGEPFYPPYAIVFAYLSSIKQFNSSVGDIVYNDLKIFAAGTFLGVISYFVLVYVRSVMNKDDANLLASAEWGDEKTLKDNGLMDVCGVVFGQTFKAVIDVDSSKGGTTLYVKKIAPIIQYHMNVCAMLMCPSRSGKGVTCVITTHINFPDSIISLDPKGENYKITAGWRMKFSYVYKFSPVTYETLRFNFMEEISEENAYRDANMIATILCAPSNPASNADPHWEMKARVLMTTAILHCLCSDYEDKSLPGVYNFLSKATDGNGDMKKNILKEMINAKHCNEEIHQAIKRGAGEIMSAADEEMGSIFSSTFDGLSLFNDPKIAYCSQKSDFCLADFKYSELPISLYLTVPFADLDRIKALLKLIVEFICRKFSEEETSFGNEVLKHRLLIILDEFPTLGKMDTIETFAGILNGFGISFLWICQTKAQIDKLYGQNAPILDHAKFMVTFSINDDNTAEYFSKRAGTQGIIKQNVSNSGSRYDYGMNNLSISNDITERRLITANEIETLPGDCMLIYTQGAPTVIAKKISYYNDPRFMDKANLPVPILRKDLLKETVNSRVKREGDARWYSVEQQLDYIAEYDINDELEAMADVTQNENTEETLNDSNFNEKELASVLV